MTDIDLLIVGCVVTFIAVGGGYLYLRESYLEHERSASLDPVYARSPQAADKGVGRVEVR